MKLRYRQGWKVITDLQEWKEVDESNINLILPTKPEHIVELRIICEHKNTEINDSIQKCQNCGDILKFY